MDEKFMQSIKKVSQIRFFVLSAAFILAVSFHTFFSTDAVGMEKISVMVGEYENSPKISTDPNGKVVGFWPDLLDYIANEENWEIKYIHGSWGESLEGLLNGRMDIMPDVAQTEERDKIFAFSRTPVLTSWSRVYVKKGNRDIISFTDLQNKRIAVLKGSVNYESADGIKEIVQKFNLNCTFLEVDSYDKVFDALDNNLADAGVTNRNFGDKNENQFHVQKTAMMFQPNSIKFAFPKESPKTEILCERIDYHMGKLLQDSNSIYYRLLEKYFETEIAQQTVEVIPLWIKTLLKGFGVLLPFLFLVLVVSRIQVKRRTSELEVKHQALLKSEAHLRTLIETIPDLVWLKDPAGVFLSCNLKFERLLGAKEKEIRGKTDYDFVDKDLADFFREKDKAAMVAGTSIINEEEVTFADDGHKELIETVKTPMYDSGGRLIGVLGIARDITKRKEMEEEKINVQIIAGEHKNLAFVGQVAGKMAHDFNNILSIIMGNVQLALMDCKDEKIRKKLELIFEQSLRGRILTRNLVVFSKDQEPKQEFFRIGEKIDLVLNLLKKDLDGLELIKEDKPGVPELLADPGMIEHALVNLIQNSIHALSLTENPRIFIRTYCLDDKICFEIEDNGCGIPEKYLGKVYEPSFTLKGNHDVAGLYEKEIKGTGYGMANVKKCIEQHKGNIDVTSTLGSGTKVKITLPVIKKELTKDEKIEIQKTTIESEKYILLVEDEIAISDVQYTILTKEPCNHKVDIAPNGEAAIDLFEKNKYDLISLDYLFSGKMNGMDVYHHIRGKNNSIPILFVSGNIIFLESIDALKQKDTNIDHLSKPCQNKDYVNSINKLLGKSS